MNITVISLGGSIIAPDKVDSSFLRDFRKAIEKYLNENDDAALIMVTGGGSPARVYQNAYKDIAGENADPVLQDWLGIKATHLNGNLIKSIFSSYCYDEVVTNPTENISFNGRILVAAGWKPGFSTDTDAVYLSRKFGARMIINLSNISKVYTDDPRKNPEALPIDEISWKDFRKMVGDEWTPGKNTPFDPVASRLAEEDGTKVICADGRNIENLINILEGKSFIGTTIGV